MAPTEIRPTTSSPFSATDYQYDSLPDYDNDFVAEADITAFARALEAPDDPAKSPELSPQKSPVPFITALNDWRPIRQRVRRDQAKSRRRRWKKPRHGKDETREGFVYTLLKWPLLLFVLTWIVCLAVAYAVTRLYIWAYESGVTMRGRREALRKKMYEAENFEEWVTAAKKMDRYLGNDAWKDDDEYAYYNSSTIRKVRDELHRLRTSLEERSSAGEENGQQAYALADELRTVLEASMRDNFVGVENARLYSETYYGTKSLVQSFLEEASAALRLLSHTSSISPADKATFFSHLSNNYGRTALCLSGGATFAYYHFGIAKALLDADVLPNIITGTSGGALVAALLATRTNAELKKLLVPALANRINACSESMGTTTRRWWRTGAQFDSLDWARHCAWFSRGSLTFFEAYQRTGRILNITCIPSSPHSPAVLANYLTSPDCVIWSAVLASAAVPGILNPVVLMSKNPKSGVLEPYSFGHKWKDGSLRTDIPLKALNTHFNVTYSIVSQVNPHINLFFFSSRGTVGRPVTHRRGRGWRGGFLGSATEQFLKLDLTKWLQVLRHLELLPRYAEQDWSHIWLQRFHGTITIWPHARASDFRHILSDPPPPRLARILWAGMQSAWPKLKFVQNRMLIEGAVADGLSAFPGAAAANHAAASPDRGVASLADRTVSPPPDVSSSPAQRFDNAWPASSLLRARSTPGHVKRHSWAPAPAPLVIPAVEPSGARSPRQARGGFIKELGRQSMVFVDDTEVEGTASEESEGSDGGSVGGEEAEGGVEGEGVAGVP